MFSIFHYYIFLIKIFFYADEPDKPGQPEIKDYDKDFVELEWAKPESDGGTPITGYIIEKKSKSSPTWEKCAEVKGDVNNAKVDDLVEGVPYEFRVIAVNKGGQSEPSLPSATHVARAKNQAPSIDRKAMIDIKVKAGLNFELDVPVSGEPPPSKEWIFKDNMLMNTDRVRITNEDYNTKLKVTNAKRADSGVYTLNAKNINGKDSATVNVTVLGTKRNINS